MAARVPSTSNMSVHTHQGVARTREDPTRVTWRVAGGQEHLPGWLQAERSVTRKESCRLRGQNPRQEGDALAQAVGLGRPEESTEQSELAQLPPGGRGAGLQGAEGLPPPPGASRPPALFCPVHTLDHSLPSSGMLYVVGFTHKFTSILHKKRCVASPEKQVSGKPGPTGGAVSRATQTAPARSSSSSDTAALSPH